MIQRRVCVNVNQILLDNVAISARYVDRGLNEFIWNESLFKENYYGLNENSPEGCRPCACHPGGSYSFQCDVNSGQCQCREGMMGRQCDTPAPGTYCAGLQFFTYEAELARVQEKVN